MKNRYGYVAILLSTILLISIIFCVIFGKVEKKNEENFTIVTSFYPMYVIALNLVDGVSNVELDNLSEPQTGCLHDYVLTKHDLILLSSADLFLVNGGGIESFLSDVAKDYPNLEVVEATEGLSLIEGEEHEHNHDSDHDLDQDSDHEEDHEAHHEDEENAHAWMSVSSYRTMVRTVADALMTADPEHAKKYDENALAYDKKLADLQSEMEETFSSMEEESVCILHEAFAYFASDMGAEVSCVLDLDGGETGISPSQVKETIEEIKEHKTQFLLAEDLVYSQKTAETIQSEIDIKIVYIDPLTRGEYKKDAYLEGMKQNLEAIKEQLDAKNN